MIKATKMQEEVLESNSRVTLLAVGAGAGATYSLFLKAITSPKNVSIITAGYKTSQVLFGHFSELFEEEIQTVAKVSQSIKLLSGIVVRFHTLDDTLDLNSRILIDNVHYIDDNVMLDIVLKKAKDLTVTSKPYECGWRNPEYDNGLKTGCFVNASWDYKLVATWETGETRALPSSYCDDVRLIQGYDVNDNKVLVKENTCYVEALEKLNPSDKTRLQGGWLL